MRRKGVAWGRDENVGYPPVPGDIGSAAAPGWVCNALAEAGARRAVLSGPAARGDKSGESATGAAPSGGRCSPLATTNTFSLVRAWCVRACSCGVALIHGNALTRQAQTAGRPHQRRPPRQHKYFVHGLAYGTAGSSHSGRRASHASGWPTVKAPARRIPAVTACGCGGTPAPQIHRRARRQDAHARHPAM